MLIYITTAVLLSFGYVVLLSSYRWYWLKLVNTKSSREKIPSTFITVIVPARNEANCIEDCLTTLLEQQYPPNLYEIIVVDDHSQDQTAALVKAIASQHDQVSILELATIIDPRIQIGSYKKKAIEEAIERAQGTLIACTDADCIMPTTWLSQIAICHEEQAAEFIAGPVQFVKEQSLFERFQSLDFLGMMVITGAGINGRFLWMCNGANLAYSKASFEAVGGFAGVDQLASGDDMLLLQKMAAKTPKHIRYLKTTKAVVSTRAKSTLKGFIQQRVRWASKSGSYQDWRTQFQLAWVWLFCCTLWMTLLLSPFWGWPMLLLLVGQWLFKAFADFFLLQTATHFFQRKALMKVFLPSLFLHGFYIVWVGFLGMLPRRYQWKGRQVK